MDEQKANQIIESLWRIEKVLQSIEYYLKQLQK